MPKYDDPGVPTGATPILTPAYGRDYKTHQEAIRGFESGQDWILNLLGSRWNGKPCNIQNMREQEFPEVKLRYNRLEDFYYYRFAEHRVPA